MASLVGVRLKIERAYEHMQALDTEIKERLRGKQYRVTERFDPLTGEIGEQTSNVPELPREWGLIVGDFAHNARSALDHLVWQLALLNTHGAARAKRAGDEWPPTNTEFPIYAEFRNANAKKRMKEKVSALRPEHRKLVLAQQPHLRGNAATE